MSFTVLFLSEGRDSRRRRRRLSSPPPRFSEGFCEIVLGHISDRFGRPDRALLPRGSRGVGDACVRRGLYACPGLGPRAGASRGGRDRADRGTGSAFVAAAEIAGCPGERRRDRAPTDAARDRRDRHSDRSSRHSSRRSRGEIRVSRCCDLPDGRLVRDPIPRGGQQGCSSARLRRPLRWTRGRSRLRADRRAVRRRTARPTSGRPPPGAPTARPSTRRGPGGSRSRSPGRNPGDGSDDRDVGPAPASSLSA